MLVGLGRYAKAEWMADSTPICIFSRNESLVHESFRALGSSEKSGFGCLRLGQPKWSIL